VFVGDQPFPPSATTLASASTPADAGTRDETRLPSFAGHSLDGKPLSTKDFAGKRLILFCFNPSIEQAAAFAQALAKVAPERSRYNFAIAAVALGLDPAKARAFVGRFGLDVPIFDDSDGDIAMRLGLQSPVVLVGSDADGRVGLVTGGVEHEHGASAAAIEARIREFLRLPAPDAVADGRLDEHPSAPLFEADRVDGRGRFRLRDLDGKPVVLVFFLSTCPHCQQALHFFGEQLARLPEGARPAFVGVAIDKETYDVDDTLRDAKLDFFAPLADPGHEIATAYGAFAGVPDVVLIDANGRIVFRNMGWNAVHDPDLLRMWLARLAGIDVPMLVSSDGYSGNDSCAVCHSKEAATWRFTAHATAFDTLVTRGADHDAKCIGCHVVGFGAPRGFSEIARQSYLEDVGCETCHGRGGGHERNHVGAPAGAPAADYRAACLHCHDAEHSLGFRYEEHLPLVSHALIAALGDSERAALVAGRERPRDLLPTTSDFIGSAACRACHEHEYDVWSSSAHARSVESLRRKDKEADDACLPCHVTGYGRPGGFPADASVLAHEDLARVGCESCHGPGAEHVRGAGKLGVGVVKLGDKCDSCVILQICGSCHDDANDPGFRFEVERKIDLQRHGPQATK